MWSGTYQKTNWYLAFYDSWVGSCDAARPISSEKVAPPIIIDSLPESDTTRQNIQDLTEVTKELSQP